VPQPRAIVPDSGGVRPGLNVTGVTIAKSRIVKKATTAVDAITPATDGTAHCYGVTMEAIPDGIAGDVQVEGRAIVEASDVITAGQNVTGAAGGKAAVASAGDFVLGQAASASTADGELIEVDIIRTAIPA
jgi:hypothetical protein